MNNFFSKIFRFLIGKPRDPKDKTLLHNISLVAFFAWIGLGSDGLSSSAYGPQEAFSILQSHMYLGIYIAIASALTVFIISASYSQIIELFPNGGGGYLVASRLLSPSTGMIAGCALLIDYVATITVSVASGADAIFSFLPVSFLQYKLPFAAFVLVLLIVLNLRGVKESITLMLPIFFVFIGIHVFLILYSFSVHIPNIGNIIDQTRVDTSNSISSIGFFGLALVMIKAYSMGAGTYTGIEAVSNGISVLREPRVKTAKKTMLYMALSLAFMVIGIMFSYVFYNVQFVEGKALYAVLYMNITHGFDPNIGAIIVYAALFSEAMILFVAAQTGFIGGPRILANMAIDKWMPKRFALLSDRLVTMNGILIMGGASLLLLFVSRGNLTLLIVFYSINVFLTFTLSQMGMVRHWWNERKKTRTWAGPMTVNGIGLILTAFILCFITVIKFNEGGWLALLVTGGVAIVSIAIKQNYNSSKALSNKLDEQVLGLEPPSDDFIPRINETAKLDLDANTAVLVVKDFNGVGVHTISQILHSFKGVFKNFVFVQIGLINAGTLTELKEVETKLTCQVRGYVSLLKQHGYHAESICETALDTVDAFVRMAPIIKEKYKSAVFFGGQMVLPDESLFNRFLHNYTLFAMQKRLYKEGIPLYIVPIRVS